MVRGEGVYGPIKWLTDTEMIVDIVSGTSAGGINGVFFAHALVNNLDFGSLEVLWRNSGDIARLLRPLDQPEAAYRSLLNSEGYYEPQLRDAVANMQPYDGPPADPDLELDLYVTGTDIRGHVYTVIDDQGHAIDVKDQRAVFWLKHRPYGTQFRRDQVTSEALGRLCRLTSCFPAAFAPVFVPNSAQGADSLLQSWGQLNRDAYFLDGGLLANKPFSHAIDAICSRPVVNPVERVLCYVEPDPEHFPPSDGRPAQNASAPSCPGFFSATFQGAYSIPTYQSIAEDLNRINEHNAQVDRYRQVCGGLQGKLAGLFTDGALPAGTGIPPTLKQPEATIYTRSRMASIGMRAIRGLAAHQGEKSRLNEKRKEKARNLVSDLLKMPSRPASPGQRSILNDADSLKSFDVYFRLRRLHHVLYFIAERSKSVVVPQSWKELRMALNERLQTLEIIRYWMEYVVDHVMDPDDEAAQLNWLKLDAETLWGNLRWYMERFLDGAAKLQRTDRVRLHRELGELAREVSTKIPDDHFAASFTGLLALTDQDEAACFSGKPADFAAEYKQFIALDAVVFPMEFISDLGGRDFINILRLSPVDAQTGFAKRRLADKLAGVSLAHFGAFFKRSWRSNDILWGRMDAIAELLKQTLSAERLKEVVHTPALAAAVLARFGRDSSRIQCEFPHSAPESSGQVHDWIRRLCHPAERDAALTQREDMTKLITEMAQLEALFECYPKVLADMTYEKEIWKGREPAEAQAEADHVEISVRKAYFAAPAVASPRQNALGAAVDAYKVGDTGVADVSPPLVTAETFSQAALVLRNCVFGDLGSSRKDTVAKNPLFKFGVDWPLRMTHWIAGMWIKEPTALRTLAIVLFFVSLAALGFAYVAGWGVASAHFLPMVAAPLAILLVEYWIATPGLGIWRVIAGLLLAAVIVFVVLWHSDFALFRALHAGFDAFRKAMP